VILISLGLIFVMLIIVYPLKMVFSALFAWISGGWFPTSFKLQAASDLPNLFVIYGLGFFTLTGAIVLLYARALGAAAELGLNELERLKTREEISSFGVLAITGLTSALLAWILPAHLAVWCGFVYATLPLTMSLTAINYQRKAQRLKRASSETPAEPRPDSAGG
jgi:hypothetical protein